MAFTLLWSLLTLLFLNNVTAYAEWVSLGDTGSAGGYTVYVDPDTIRSMGSQVKMWSLLDFKTTQTEEQTLFLSSRAQQQYDCEEERFRALAYTRFSDNMGRGTAVFNTSGQGTWQPVAPDSIGHALWEFACAKQRLHR